MVKQKNDIKKMLLKFDAYVESGDLLVAEKEMTSHFLDRKEKAKKQQSSNQSHKTLINLLREYVQRTNTKQKIITNLAPKILTNKVPSNNFSISCLQPGKKFKFTFWVPHNLLPVSLKSQEQSPTDFQVYSACDSLLRTFTNSSLNFFTKSHLSYANKDY
jgi:hypothetical protein